MNAIELRALLEHEIAWRQDELRTIRNALNTGGADEETTEHRRTLIVMSYAHLEGFVKQALGTYADHINRTRMPCGELSDPIAAPKRPRRAVARD